MRLLAYWRKPELAPAAKSALRQPVRARSEWRFASLSKIIRSGMKPSLDQIEADIIHLAADTAKTKSQSPEDISAETMLRENLEFSSMDLIHLLASIDMHFHRKLKY